MAHRGSHPCARCRRQRPPSGQASSPHMREATHAERFVVRVPVQARLNVATLFPFFCLLARHQVDQGDFTGILQLPYQSLCGVAVALLSTACSRRVSGTCSTNNDRLHRRPSITSRCLCPSTGAVLRGLWFNSQCKQRDPKHGLQVLHSCVLSWPIMPCSCASA
jgi:hypothetical protein